MTVFADGHDLSSDLRAKLANRAVSVVSGRIVAIVQSGDHGATLKLDTGEELTVDILFAQPRDAPSASLHEAIGLTTVATPTGTATKVDDRRDTSMPGIYAAGDLANRACHRSPRRCLWVQLRQCRRSNPC